MPRNGSSVYSLPAGNPVIPGTVIATTWANTTLTDIATALTNSLSTDGSTASVSLAGKTMTGGTFSGPTVTSTLTLTGGQIAFPAVAVPSANANTLDDYEEGTWTPTLTFATPGNLVVVYSVRVGAYTKIGDTVTLYLKITTSTWTWTTSSGNLQITGLPFAAANVASQDFCGSVTSLTGITTSASTYINLQLVNNTSLISLFGNDAVSGSSNVLTTANAATATNKNILISMTYKTAT